MMIQNILLHVNEWLHNQSRIIQRAFYPKEPENGHTEVEKSHSFSEQQIVFDVDGL